MAPDDTIGNERGGETHKGLRRDHSRADGGTVTQTIDTGSTTEDNGRHHTTPELEGGSQWSEAGREMMISPQTTWVCITSTPGWR